MENLVQPIAREILAKVAQSLSGMTRTEIKEFFGLVCPAIIAFSEKHSSPLLEESLTTLNGPLRWTAQGWLGKKCF